MRAYMKKIILVFVSFFVFCFLVYAAEDDNLSPSGKLVDGVRVVEVTAVKYNFDPDPIVVRFGERIRIVVRSLDVPHGLYIPDFKINLLIRPGEVKSIEFPADKIGVFEASCSLYCGIGHMEMKGKFIVLGQ